MPRVTVAEVRLIIDTERTDPQVTAYIGTGSVFVDALLLDKGLTEPQLKEIERWLSAHFIATAMERQAIHQKAGPAEQRFSDIFSKGLNNTTFGQAAIALDTSGTLLALDRRNMILKAIPE